MVEIIQLDNEEEMDNIPTHIVNINNRLEENKVIICAVYMPGCGHCVTLKPIWDETMSQFEQQQQQRPLDGMIASMNMDIPTQLDYKQEPIRGFPHIMALKGGKMIQYDKMTRTKEDLMKFVKEHIKGAQLKGTQLKGKSHIKRTMRKRMNKTKSRRTNKRTTKRISKRKGEHARKTNKLRRMKRMKRNKR
jgi:hypothetical protein